MLTDTIELIDKILSDLKNAGGVEGCAAISRDGLLIRSSMQQEQFVEVFAAMSATMLGAAETAFIEIGKSVPNRVIVESPDGWLIAVGAGAKAFLVVIVGQEAVPGLMLLELDKAAKDLKELLE